MGQQYKNLDGDKTTNHRKKRILFVNDDTDTTAVMKVGLSRHGFEVETFVDSKSALQNFKAGMYDLILLDVLMKGLDGFELYNEMRKIDENIQICFISASNSFYEKYKSLYPEIQNECFIQKPVRIKELANSINTILRN
ncbi:MAG: response regulator [Thermoproteota archaeon]|nr:response regulator [Thermoproteota archaeon]